MSELGRLRWQCRRGMKELDVLLSRYLERHYATASILERQGFVKLLALPDPELYALVMGKSDTDDEGVLSVVKSLRQH
ncbi:MAG TPA: succinate dehydrogenase assembly factor 2, partial [Gammaproteobacteria bacterium]